MGGCTLASFGLELRARGLDRRLDPREHVTEAPERLVSDLGCQPDGAHPLQASNGSGEVTHRLAEAVVEADRAAEPGDEFARGSGAAGEIGVLRPWEKCVG
ncbi:MAG: hypothetical protein AB7I08_08555 [Thermoleophilia bacterium]